MRTGETFPIVVIQEAGLDDFWIHRILEHEGIESHVVDPASIATSRRRRRAKADKIDGETLVRALLVINAESHAYARWRSHRRPKQRIGAGSAESARSWSVSGRATPIASRDCYLRKG
ncbi:hypothetical protein X737_38010 [Mesorhizobium sp. L48C026A00]|nr:hypothetical protein X737_38010 [Mesorhizobium sp. L48C026A00]